MDSGQELTLPSAAIHALALEAGFDLCGFARAERIPSEHLMDWLAAGFAADMDWMAERPDERLDIRRKWPLARTVIALACNYFHDDPARGPSPIARYARGRDYHANLRDRLRRFRKRVQDIYRVTTYASVDTGPVMEKVWAARAGLGYVGKNGCLITERFGSYVVLATLSISAAVDRYAEGPEIDRCGTCNLCASACPTDAIVAPSVVDAGRCLSYQTIENRSGHIPEPLRGAMGEVVFGCDICQDVCPLNLHPVAAVERFAPRAVASVRTRELASMSREDYERWIPGTALARAQYDGLRRNAAYALGAARDLGARPILERLASDSNERVRVAAQWALERLGNDRGA